MKCIRSVWWDGFWIGGGLWIGIALACIALFVPLGSAYTLWGPFGHGQWALAALGRGPIETALVVFFMCAIVVDTAHNMSPLLLTWTHPALRRIALVQWRWYILLPGAVMFVACAIGAATSLGWTDFVRGHGAIYHLALDWRNPFPWLVLIYVSWEVYHFGMQNFGILAIYRRINGSQGRTRTVDKFLCLAFTAALMVPPLLLAFGVPGMGWWKPPLYVVFLVVGVVSTMHWLVSIGLSLRVTQIRWWLWLPLLFVIGTVGFGWTAASPSGTMLRQIPWIMAFRFGLGFVHFLYDGFIWKRGHPAMQTVLAVNP
jgi:hypothetical protein